MKVEVGKRIREARERKNLKSGELAELCGWEETKSRISNYEKGISSPSYPDMVIIGRALDVNPGWLAFGGKSDLDVKGNEEKLINNAEDVYLSLLSESDIANNSGNLGTVDSSAHVKLSQSQLKDAGVSVSSAFCVTVEGDQMAPALPDGAIAAFDTSNTTVKDGELYVVQYGPLVQVRVLERLPVGYRLKVFNDRNYSATEVKGEETGKLTILGRVFWYSVFR